MNTHKDKGVNSKKIILDLCGGTGAWSAPYKRAGYDVRVITLPGQDVADYIPPENVYGILAAPPCTDFSLAKNGWAKDPIRGKRDFIKAMGPVNACIRIIFQCKPKFWAMENPVGLLSRWMGKAPYTFHPWYFGEPWTKFTAIWGEYNKPERKYFKYEDLPNKEVVLQGRHYNYRKKGSLPSISMFTRGCEKELRAITPKGFADAFFKANL